MTISDAQADRWSSATAKLLSGITDDPDETFESFSNNAACSSIAPECFPLRRRLAPYHTVPVSERPLPIGDLRPIYAELMGLVLTGDLLVEQALASAPAGSMPMSVNGNSRS